MVRAEGRRGGDPKEDSCLKVQRILDLDGKEYQQSTYSRLLKFIMNMFEGMLTEVIKVLTQSMVKNSS